MDDPYTYKHTFPKSNAAEIWVVQDVYMVRIGVWRRLWMLGKVPRLPRFAMRLGIPLKTY